ncbi:hypothetical protein [Marixanthomonas spongiae]|uniref:STAS/SEC14 domain-containing protein n=1 Tax=Marixanthomonas spongiae TaxID=2174845 RepID=A0A2U0I479_9FLAO|nr:hypothetical protein [Marixanthomonas spongiae]PVW15800.1 hypothetical protein DDV96_05910 [Marixanthomonas spongiae]
MKPTPPHHQLPESAVLKDVLKSKIATVYFYDDVAVVEAKEGVTLSYKTAFSLLISGLNYLRASSWVYISNRLNSYSLNPQDYRYLEKIPTLKGLAVVYESEIGKKNAEMEAKFFNKPFASFSNLTEAYNWARELLDA